RRRQPARRGPAGRAARARATGVARSVGRRGRAGRDPPRRALIDAGRHAAPGCCPEVSAQSGEPRAWPGPPRPNPDREEIDMSPSSATQPRSPQASGAEAIHPFRVSVPEDVLADLRRRIEATRWPEKETVADETQGVPLAPMRDVARYWATGYDWRRC